MNREIKFRVFRKSTNTIYKPFTIMEAINDNGQMLEDDTIVMQYTGLKDKNGKEIFEGDIITFESQQVRELRASDYRIIEWIDDEGKFNWVDAETRESTSGWSFCRKCSEKYAVIVGNIYENKELLTNLNKIN